MRMLTSCIIWFLHLRARTCLCSCVYETIFMDVWGYGPFSRTYSILCKLCLLWLAESLSAKLWGCIRCHGISPESFRKHLPFRVYIVLPLLPCIEFDSMLSTSVIMRMLLHRQQQCLSKGPNSLLCQLRSAFKCEDFWSFISFCSLRDYNPKSVRIQDFMSQSSFSLAGFGTTQSIYLSTLPCCTDRVSNAALFSCSYMYNPWMKEGKGWLACARCTVYFKKSFTKIFPSF